MWLLGTNKKKTTNNSIQCQLTVSWFDALPTTITSDWNGDCDGDGSNLGLAGGIDGDGLGVKNDPVGEGPTKKNYSNEYLNA